MPIIFVHGVNVRKDSPAYDAGTEAKRAFLGNCFAGASFGGRVLPDNVRIEFPYWGDLATTFAWQMASLPRDDMEALSVSAVPDVRTWLAVIHDAIPDAGGEPLVALARRDFQQAVELIASMSLSNVEAGDDRVAARFAVAVQKFAETNPRPSWLAQVTTDAQLIGQLGLAVSDGDVQVQGLVSGVVNRLTQAAHAIKQAATGMVGTVLDRSGDFASTKLLGWTRESLNANLGRFFGDVFIYFDSRGDATDPGPIVQRILDCIDSAVAAAPNEPLVIIGHSLGGVISFDLIGHYRPSLTVDLLVTVGSQAGHFEELKLYHKSDRAISSPKRAKTPENILRWINVYDEVDIFSYTCREIFDRVDVDARYDTKTYVIKAHGAYFDQIRFYRLLRNRIDQLQ